MDDPKYGTHPPPEIPQIELAPGVHARLLAGKLDDSDEQAARRGPFETVARVTMVDFELAPGASLSHTVPRGLNTALLYVYEGAGSANEEDAPTQSVVQYDASDNSSRGLKLVAGNKGMAALLFAGARLEEPIAWHGPIVMNTQQQLQEAFAELRSGRFPPKRVAWDYKRVGTSLA